MWRYLEDDPNIIHLVKVQYRIVNDLYFIEYNLTGLYYIILPL